MYAGFWKRFAATILDVLILIVPMLVTGIVVALITGPLSPASKMTDIGLLFLPWLYYAVMESSRVQATLGKLAFGVRVVTLEGDRISFFRACWRFVAKIFSALPFALGFLVAAVTRRKQALHDVLASCLVVNAHVTVDDLREDGFADPLSLRARFALLFLAVLLPVAVAAAMVGAPKYEEYLLRKKLDAAVRAGQGATSDVGAYMAKHRTPPRSLAEAGATAASPHLREVTIGRDGTIVLTIAVPPLEGKRIALVPSKQAQNAIVWTCTSDEVPARYLPRQCRSRR